jgi:hypothetical protein
MRLNYLCSISSLDPEGKQNIASVVRMEKKSRQAIMRLKEEESSKTSGYKAEETMEDAIN